MQRTVYFISDGTGITAEALGRSLLTQFDGIEFNQVIIPYVDSREKAQNAIAQINQCYYDSGSKPIIFSTLINPEVRSILTNGHGFLVDFFHIFIGPLEQELGVKSSDRIGKTHGLQDDQSYAARIEAVNFALTHDDGTNIHNYDKAHIILIGVSRSAKTPTCLYMALQFGVYAANYPFTEEDMGRARLPDFLRKCRDKLFGLTIDANRLHAIRTERRPNSRYASVTQCEKEVHELEALYRIENIPYIGTTTRSIEEISTTIINHKKLKRQLY